MDMPEADSKYRDSLLEMIPERCRPCYRPQIDIAQVSVQVICGEINEREGRERILELAQDLGKMCKYGYEIDTESCFGGGDCSYGVMCRFPTNNQGLGTL